VKKVEVWNRSDCCRNRLNRAGVYVNNRRCGIINHARTKNTVQCHNKRGRYVKVQLLGRNYLTICEVRVYAGGKAKGRGKSHVYNPPEHSRRYSSIRGNNRIGTGHARSKLNSHQAWSARHNHRNQWLQMNMHGYKWVKGIVMQGRRHSGQRVTAFRVYGHDGRRWFWVDGGRRFHTPRAYKDRKQTVYFRKSYRLRYVRIYVWSWSHHISCRVGVVVGRSSSKKAAGKT